MFTSIFRPRALFSGPRTALAAAVVLVALCGACGGERPEPSADGPQIRAMRFAGVDLVYALERVAAESGLVLALDEIAPRDLTPDLGLYRVDVDLPAGSALNALRELRRLAGGFDFELLPGVIYARSQLAVTTTTPIDLPVLPKATFEGDIDALLKHIASAVPGSYITQQTAAGTPKPPIVKLEIADKSSIKSVLVQYAQLGKVGWTMRRSGQVVEQTDKGYVVVATSLELRAPRTSRSRRPETYLETSTVGALADLSARLEQPLVVYDRSILFDLRGMLNFGMQIDPKDDLEPSLSMLAESGFGPENYHFKYRQVDGVPELRSRHYLYWLRGRDLFRAELLPGEFEGSLPELARWINTHQKSPNGEVLMGGEIIEGLPRGKVTVTPGMNGEQLLNAFAKSSRVSPYVVVLDMMNPISGQTTHHPNAWRGSYLQDLQEWRQTSDKDLRRKFTPPPTPGATPPS